MDTDIENTECYKCGEETTAFYGTVHPLCQDCQNEFDGWFELALNGKA